MNRLLRGVALVAAGAAAMSLYRQWQRLPHGQRRRHHLDTWENEGGAVPESARQLEADVPPRLYSA